MAKTSIYLNFERETEEAFGFYRKVLGSEYEGEVTRFGDMPYQEGQSPLPKEDKNLIMHISLPLPGGVLLHGNDVPPSMGFAVNQGNNVYIMLEPDTRAETEKLFSALVEGGKVDMELQDMFWGDYFGSLVDRFGVQWMLNCSAK